jgi:hypothetical protein
VSAGSSWVQGSRGEKGPLTSVIASSHTWASVDPGLEVTAGWGYRNAQGAVMPGQGRVERRPFRDAEGELLTEDEVRLFDSETCDIFLNERTLWRNVPLAAWNYKIGGYRLAEP